MLFPDAVQHVLPELFTLDRLLGFAETTLLIAGNGDHLDLRAAITNDDVFETLFLQCQNSVPSCWLP